MAKYIIKGDPKLEEIHFDIGIMQTGEYCYTELIMDSIDVFGVHYPGHPHKIYRNDCDEFFTACVSLPIDINGRLIFED